MRNYFWIVSTDKLYESLRNLLLADPSQGDVKSMEFNITMQPNMISYDGHYVYENGKEEPINLKLIGKYQCHLFTEFLKQFHLENTDDGKDRWNKVTIKRIGNGEFQSVFEWDDKWEQENIDSYNGSEIERPKWYWEEK